MMIDIRNNFLKMRHVPVQKRKNELKIVVKGTATRVNVAIDAKRFHDMCQQSAVNANTTTLDYRPVYAWPDTLQGWMRQQKTVEK